jgi:hypothetical protein
MDSHEFNAFWSIPDKCVNEDISFLPHRTLRDVFEFEGVEIITSSHDGVLLNGKYHCGLGAVSYNMVLVGTGAITRFCLGFNRHDNVGRFHQHLIKNKECVRRQLPYAIDRHDYRSLTAQQAWTKLCVEAGITHVGQFFEPEVLCR